MSSPDSKKVVLAALAGNVAIALCKFVAAYLSRSTATLAEAVHSLADTGNQGLLLVGMQLAAQPASDRFPFGRAAERYFWPFIVALMLFSVGGAFAIYEGIDHLIHPHVESGSRISSYVVLSVSIVFETFSFRVAYKEFQVLAAGRPLAKVIADARDPTIILVLAEDLAALVGLVVALIAVALSGITGEPMWDSLGSIVIGCLLCIVAIALARMTHGMLIGESATPDDHSRVLELAESTSGVEKVTQVLAMHLGPDVVILAMKIAFRPSMPVEEVEETTNRIEEKIRAVLPQMQKIFIEADSKGDGRGTMRKLASANLSKHAVR